MIFPNPFDKLRFISLDDRAFILCRNNVKVYGTVIIEYAIGKPCPTFEAIFGTDIKQLLMSPADFASSLNDIRKIYGFEGWLVNFENEFSDVRP